MWLTFWPDVLVAVIGAVLTVAIAFSTYLLRLRLQEKRALQSLINQLHRRRAFAGRAVVIRGARDSDDFKRASSSVSNVRDEIRRTRDDVRRLDDLQRPLSDMTRACNRFLELSDAMPDHYAIQLSDLRQELFASITELARVRSSVRALEPGGGAF